MTPEFWLERWQKSEIGFHQQDINSHLQAFWPKLHPIDGGLVLVPLCGKSRDMLWLRGQGHPVLGVDISPIAVRAFFTENGLPATTAVQVRHKRWQSDGVTLLEGDFFKLARQDTEHVSHMFDRASLVALPPELRGDYARHVQAILPEHANILLVAFEYDQTQMAGPPFSVSTDEIHALFRHAYDIQLLHGLDVSADFPQFSDRGLTRLEEKIYTLTPLIHRCCPVQISAV